jgi:trk system potassium uptake protein TrkH
VSRRGVLRTRSIHPARLVVLAFALTILMGTALLALPVASASGHGSGLVTALFTATSAVCVTGLSAVDTATFWSGFGQVTIIALVQLGGFGIMSLASLAALLVSHRLGLRTRLLARTETGALDLGDVRIVLFRIARVTFLVEVTASLALAARFWTTYDEALPRSLWLGVFHAVSAFNNAGFALFSDNLIGFVGDPIVLLVVGASIVIGGLGFPVLSDLRRERLRWRRWSLHTKLTLVTTAVLLVVGAIAILAFEWSNPATFGRLDTADSVAAGIFGSVTPRTAGFNAVDYGQVTESTTLVTMLLMFIGGGSASTAGGIKVSTAAVIALMVWSEVRGEPDVSRFGRRIPPTAQRQALSVVMIALFALFAGNLLLIGLSQHGITDSLFEATSALGTVGLTTGITGALPDPAQLVLVALMFLGRVGPLTLGTALVLRERERLHRFPEERPLVG